MFRIKNRRTFTLFTIYLSSSQPGSANHPWRGLKGIRIAIARKARSAGFIAEFRNLGNALYVRKSEKQLEEKPMEKSAAENSEEKLTRKKKSAMP